MLDSKTRWNSLLAMLERILEIKSSISKALIDCNQELGTFDLERQDDTSLPVLPNKTVLILLAKKMLSRLSCTPADVTESSSSAAEEEKTVQSSSMSLTEKLDAAIKSDVIEKSEPLDNNNTKHLQKELNIF